MSRDDQFFIENFERPKGYGRVASRRILVESPEEAIRLARLAAGHFPGVIAVALKRSEAGEVRSVLTHHGRVPEDFADTLRNG